MTFYTQDGNTDTEEGPGMLRSLTYWVGGSIAAVGFWTVIAIGLDALRYYWRYL
jgi:hypothetical protein